MDLFRGGLSGGTATERKIGKRVVGENLCINGLSARQVDTFAVYHTCVPRGLS